MAAQLATLTPTPQNGAQPLITSKGQPMPPSPSYLQQQQEAERHARLERAWKAYTGEQPGHFRPEPGQPDVNVITNRASTVVDTGVDFLYGKTVTLEVLYKGKPQKDAQAALDGCWGKDAKRMTLLSKLGQNGGIFGHVFAKIIPPNPQKMRPYCRIVPLDPAQVSVITDPSDCDTVLAYIVDWQEPAGGASKLLSVGKRQIIVRRDPDEDAEDYDEGLDPDSTWEISNWLRGPNQQWYMVGEPETWEHPWAPVVDWQNLPLANQHWGMADIPPNVQHLNSVLNLTLSNINMIAKHHSFPWLYASGVGLGSQIEVGPGKLTQLQAPDAKLAALEAHGDVPGLLNFAADLRSDMDEQTRVPSVATGRLRDVPRVTSGVAMEMMYGPLLGKTTHKQRLYETGHEEASLRALSLCGYGDGTGQDGWEVVTHWPSPLPKDDAATAQLLLAGVQAGMSEHWQCEVIGVDYDTEMQYREDEAQAQLKAAAKGLGMPVLPPPATTPDANQPQGQPGQPGDASQPQGQPGQPGGAGGGNVPPVNHPAAVAARQAAKAAGAAMRGAAASGRGGQ